MRQEDFQGLKEIEAEIKARGYRLISVASKTEVHEFCGPSTVHAIEFSHSRSIYMDDEEARIAGLPPTVPATRSPARARPDENQGKSESDSSS